MVTNLHHRRAQPSAPSSSRRLGHVEHRELAKAQEGYYLDGVARGYLDGVARDYLEGEAPGRWLGAGTALLGLASEVGSDALSAVLDGRDPTTETPLRSSPGGRVPGFDLTFRAPKSVSVVFGLAEADISGVAAEAHDLAVDAALRYLSGTPRGPRAARRHRTDPRGRARRSRLPPPDQSRRRSAPPHPRARRQRRSRRRWPVVDGRPRHCYWHSKTAGYLYEAHLRSELTA